MWCVVCVCFLLRWLWFVGGVYTLLGFCVRVMLLCTVVVVVVLLGVSCFVAVVMFPWVLNVWCVVACFCVGCWVLLSSDCCATCCLDFECALCCFACFVDGVVVFCCFTICLGFECAFVITNMFIACIYI